MVKAERDMDGDNVGKVKHKEVKEKVDSLH